jgi:hypothetical protein
MTAETRLEFVDLLTKKNVPFTIRDLKEGLLEVSGFIVPKKYVKTFTLVCNPGIFFKMEFDFIYRYWILYFSIDKCKWYHLYGIKHNVETDGPDFIYQEGGIILYRDHKDVITEVYFDKYEDGVKILPEPAEKDSHIPAIIKHQMLSQAYETGHIETNLEVMDSALFHHGVDGTFGILNISLDDALVELSEDLLLIPPVYKTHTAIKRMYSIDGSNKYLIQLK